MEKGKEQKNNVFIESLKESSSHKLVNLVFISLSLTMLCLVVYTFWAKNQLQLIEKPIISSDEDDKSNKCVISGCSSEMCSDDHVVTNCIYQEHFICYQDALCEIQPSGVCGWTPTEDLQACLGKFSPSFD